jgi:hypothetical protein
MSFDVRFTVIYRDRDRQFKGDLARVLEWTATESGCSRTFGEIILRNRRNGNSSIDLPEFEKTECEFVTVADNSNENCGVVWFKGFVYQNEHSYSSDEIWLQLCRYEFDTVIPEPPADDLASPDDRPPSAMSAAHNHSAHPRNLTAAPASQGPMGGGLGAGGRSKRSLPSSSVVTPERPRREAKQPAYYTPRFDVSKEGNDFTALGRSHVSRTTAKSAVGTHQTCLPDAVYAVFSTTTTHMCLSTARSIMPENGEAGATISAAQQLVATADGQMESLGCGFSCNELKALTVDDGWYIISLNLFVQDPSLRKRDSHAVAFVKMPSTFGRIIDNMASTPFIDLSADDVACQQSARDVFRFLFPGAAKVTVACVYKITGVQAK